MASWGQGNFRDSASGVAEGLVSFHDFSLIVILFVMSFVGAVMSCLSKNKLIHKKLSSNHLLELVWTLLPAGILMMMVMPSLSMLFLLEDSAEAHVVVKAIGRQWFWVYSWSNKGEQGGSIESLMIPESQGSADLFRLLDTTAALYLPVEVSTRVFISASDVLHSWTVPSLGVKADACPGRLNEVAVHAMRPGVFFGQCSEICGANHSFMPIQVVAWAWE